MVTFAGYLDYSRLWWCCAWDMVWQDVCSCFCSMWHLILCPACGRSCVKNVNVYIIFYVFLYVLFYFLLYVKFDLVLPLHIFYRRSGEKLKYQANRPFPNYLRPLFQSESRCSCFHMQINFHSHGNEFNLRVNENWFAYERMSTLDSLSKRGLR